MAKDATRKAFAKILTETREARGLSRRELAVLAKTSHQTIRAFEVGEGKRLDVLERIVGRLGLELNLDPVKRSSS